MTVTIIPAPRDDEGPDPANCILCTNVGPGCPYHGGRS
jgi:hypothetical protein